MHLVRRIAIIWVIDALALWFLAPVVPGLELRSWIWAFLAVAAIGLLNALVRPFLLFVMLPFTVLSLGLLSIVLNAGIILLVDPFVPGLGVANIGAAIWVVLGTATINTIVTGLLSINDDESFYRNVIARFARRSRAENTSDSPGVILLEIDGLSDSALDLALESGYMPVLSKWLSRGDYRITSWNCGLPSQSSSSQAGILYGRNDNIPAFRWYEKSERRMMVSNWPSTASAIHRRLSDGTGLLANNGSSLSNLVTGDAPNSQLTISSLPLGPVAMRDRSYSYYVFFLNPYSFSRLLVRVIWEILREIGQRTRSRMQRSPEPETRGGTFPLLRAVSTVFLRELTLYLLIEDMLAGTPAVYSTFLGYDVVAHHAGPLNRDALGTLRQFDENLGALERTAERAPRPYEFALLSDHGQSPGASFRQRFGLTLEQLVERAIDGTEMVTAPLSDDEGWAHLNALLSQAIQIENLAGRTARRLLQRRIRDGYVNIAPQPSDDESGSSNVVVCTSGNLGMVYVTETERRVTLEEFTAWYPRLVPALVSHPGIGFVLVRSRLFGAVAIGRWGVNYIDRNRVEGVDPLAMHQEDARKQLSRLDRFSNVGDLLINSVFYPRSGEVAAFEDQVGSHGGLGGDQTRAFIVHPSHWPAPESPISGPSELNAMLRVWMDHSSKAYGEAGKVESTRRTTAQSSPGVSNTVDLRD